MKLSFVMLIIFINVIADTEGIVHIILINIFNFVSVCVLL